MPSSASKQLAVSGGCFNTTYVARGARFLTRPVADSQATPRSSRRRQGAAPNALFADRLSCSDFLANAFRLLLHAVAYRICLALAKIVGGLTGEIWQFDTLRLRLIKVAGLFVEQSRRIILHLPAAFPFATLWAKISAVLSGPPLPA